MEFPFVFTKTLSVSILSAIKPQILGYSIEVNLKTLEILLQHARTCLKSFIH